MMMKAGVLLDPAFLSASRPLPAAAFFTVLIFTAPGYPRLTFSPVALRSLIGDTEPFCRSSGYPETLPVFQKAHDSVR